MNIAIIPARGGSKRIPRKNIKLFFGLPVISYAIARARECEVIDKVYVSTDDIEIADIANKFGAQVIQLRPSFLATDKVTTIQVMSYESNFLSKINSNIINICCIYPVTPLLTSSSILEGYKVLEKSNWNYVVSAIKNFPSSTTFTIGEAGGICTRKKIINTFKRNYSDAGQFYWGGIASWKLGKEIISNNSTIIELPKKSVIDVNTHRDWKLCEELYKLNFPQKT
jgi:N-acylneuraminate cytidylyltransferase